MAIFEKQLKSYIPRLGAVLVLLSFGVMTGLSPVLHAHELDFSAAHDDCAPCHWSQSKETDKSVYSSLDTPTAYQFFKPTLTENIETKFINKLFSRGPPPLS